MITADTGRRQSILSEVQTILAREASPGDRDLLLSLAPIAHSNMPDAMALGLSPEAIAARIHEYFHFVVRTMPPAHQLYRGLPGIHVVARNLTEEEARHTGSTHGGQHEITVVETHTPDAPFIFESLKNFFLKEGLRVFSAIHPIFTVKRQWERITAIGGPHEDGSRELLCHFRIERIEPKERLRRIEHQIHSLLRSVFLAVEDFEEMTRYVRDKKGRLRDRNGTPDGEAAARGFLDWLIDENYVLMGILRFRSGPNGFEPDYDAALGCFREPGLMDVVFPGVMEEEARHLQISPKDDRIIDIDYRNNASAIHHLEPVDDIVVREWGPDGKLQAATLLLGRLAKSAFTAKAESIPILKEKLTWLLDNCGEAKNSHAYRATRAYFNHLPKRELFYSSAESLKTLIDRMVYMSSDDDIVVSARETGKYSALGIAFSDSRYSSKTGADLKEALGRTFGPVSFSTTTDCGAVALLLFYFDSATLEHPLEPARIREITAGVISTWEDQVGYALEKTYGAIEGRRLFKRYIRSESRSGLYREATQPSEVPEDVRHFEVFEGRLELGLLPDTPETAVLKLITAHPLALTETLRTIQNLGLKVVEEMRIPLLLPESKKAWLERLKVEAEPSVISEVQKDAARLHDALRAIFEERATDDPLNSLVLKERMSWREVEVLRTVRNHLLQIRPHYNVETVTSVLVRNSAVARSLWELFDARFNPSLPCERPEAISLASGEAATAFAAVGSLLDDEILRGVENLLAAAVRTNYYQRPSRPVISIKVECAKVGVMVSPRPLFEIYVHSRLLEGIHLRGGKVARGGIRWSDRHDDFRTEVLGLMKTQMVKNSVIVPVGSKGGFVLKGNVPPRPALDSYLIDRYREFVSGLLDVTDNLVDGAVVHPPEVIRHDEPDPYLVVAADKGTAHLSDTANRVSAQYGFWLGDAFASGGSNGYDHKKEGITARGAWECVKHHFKNLGMDIQSEPFTMAGIGDMSGDVFGNGALLSTTTRLVAAFNHVHIFLDPNPDPVSTFAERQRLFALPRSTWRDYNTALISAGGGIFDRSAKAIPLSEAVRQLLDLQQEAASGEEVVRAILRSKVDLLYNGGIGTYVKASAEEDADVGDRANDRVRVNGNELRARVLGEGGNLGLTQRGRIEYWLNGGLLNTDAVDNSGGVDMSDHEVNIKILLDLLVRRGIVRNRPERNCILAGMTEEVSELVLADNANQAQALTLDGIRSARRYEDFVALIESFIGAGIMRRRDDGIPSQEELRSNARRDRGLPRPLLCVTLGHVKNWAFARLLNSTVPDSQVARPFLSAYFPSQMRKDYGEHLDLHPLRREIIATAAVNHVINHAGISVLHRMMAASGRELGDVVEAYLAADRAAEAADLRRRIRESGRNVAEQHELLVATEDKLEAAALESLAGNHVNLQEELATVRGAAG
ncbi:MAG: NAD-glutamate dehydrogenase [Thermoanaerobaculia bacterium]|nr:NAD-glutamate dehydrogenase [Thermoanaerobaculia bacterium]